MSAETHDIVLVLTTAPDAEVAGALAKRFVEAGLAACVNVLPGVVSHYRWEGALHADGELLLICKTTRARLAALEADLTEAHPYDVPELVVLGAEAASEAYGAWVRAQVGG